MSKWNDIRMLPRLPEKGRLVWIIVYGHKEPRLARYIGDESFYDGSVGSNMILGPVEFWMNLDDCPPEMP